MTTEEKIVELQKLDFTGEDLKRIEEEASEEYSAAAFKSMITEFTAGMSEQSTEDFLATLAKHFYTLGYVEACEDVADQVGSILAKGNCCPFRSMG